MSVRYCKHIIFHKNKKEIERDRDFNPIELLRWSSGFKLSGYAYWCKNPCGSSWAA